MRNFNSRKDRLKARSGCFCERPRPILIPERTDWKGVAWRVGEVIDIFQFQKGPIESGPASWNACPVPEFQFQKGPIESIDAPQLLFIAYTISIPERTDWKARLPSCARSSQSISIPERTDWKQPLLSFRTCSGAFQFQKGPIERFRLRRSGCRHCLISIPERTDWKTLIPSFIIRCAKFQFQKGPIERRTRPP